MTTWYAQNSAANIDSANMWNDVAAGGGNVLTWASLGASDVLVANGKTGIAINVDFTCAKISNAAYSGTAAGQFTVTTASSARTITASVEAQDGGTATTCLAATLHASNRLTITGNITGGSVASSNAVSTATTNGLMTVNGTITGGSTAANTLGISSGAALNLTVTGTITGGSTATAYGIRHANAGVLTLSCAAVTAGSAPAISESVSSSTVITVTGAISASSSLVTAILTTGIVVMSTGSSIISNSTSWYFPVSGRIKWESTNTGMTITLYDASAGSHVLKVPDYPATTDVKNAVQFDYTTKTGTYSAAGGGGAPVFGGHVSRRV